MIVFEAIQDAPMKRINALQKQAVKKADLSERTMRSLSE